MVFVRPHIGNGRQIKMRNVVFAALDHPISEKKQKTYLIGLAFLNFQGIMIPISPSFYTVIWGFPVIMCE